MVDLVVFDCPDRLVLFTWMSSAVGVGTAVAQELPSSSMCSAAEVLGEVGGGCWLGILYPQVMHVQTCNEQVLRVCLYLVVAEGELWHNWQEGRWS